MPIVPMRSVLVRILSRPVPIRIPYCSRIRVTTAAGSIAVGVFRHETVFDSSDASGNISRPMAVIPRRIAAPDTVWRRKRSGSPSSRMRRAATFSAPVRCVGIETGCRRAAPSATLPPRETGIHHSFQRSRSYT